MKLQWPSGEMVLIGKENDEITSEQWNTLEKLQERHELSDPVEVLPGLGYIGIMAGSMFIGIETDGHAHT